VALKSPAIDVTEELEAFQNIEIPSTQEDGEEVNIIEDGKE